MSKQNTLNIESPLPGIYEGVSDPDYFSIEACNNSKLSLLGKTPAHSKLEHKDTPAMFLGRAIHCYVLDGKERFKERYRVTKKMSRNTKVWKALVEDETRELIQADEFFKVYGVYNGIQTHPRAKEILDECLKEVVVIWFDIDTGLLCKAKIDLLAKFGYIADLKSTKDATPVEFYKAIGNLGYNRQGYHYLSGINSESPHSYYEVKFIACEPKPPFRVEIITIMSDSTYMAYGKMDTEELLRLELKCQEEQFWPHYTMNFHTGGYEHEAECPAWMGTRG